MNSQGACSALRLKLANSATWMADCCPQSTLFRYIYITEAGVNNPIISPMSFYRSQTVKHYKLILPRDNAEELMHHLGQLNLIHIVPIDAPILDRPYIRQVKLCSDCLARLQEVEAILSDKGILVRKQHFSSKEYDDMFEEWGKFSEGGRLNLINVMNSIEKDVEDTWHMYKNSAKRLEEIKSNIDFVRQNLAIIKAGSAKFGEAFLTGSTRSIDEIQFQFKDIVSPQVNLKAGVIKIQDEFPLKRTAFRISRNNCFVVFIPFSSVFEQLRPGEEDKLVVFFLFSGVKGGTLERKLDRLVSGFSAQNYILPHSINELRKCKEGLEDKLVESEHLLKLNETEFREYLTHVAQFLPGRSFSRLEANKLYLMKQKQIYTQLNEMRVYSNFLQGNIYIRSKDIATFHKCLKQIESQSKFPSGQLLQAREENPPTLFHRNLYTCTAQQIVETYGVPTCKEANPAFFTVITFPFLFGVMFGDIAHGLLILCFGIYLTFFRNRFPIPFLKIIQPHRYMIVLMGFFATYCGFIYNDFMSISLNLFGSCYNVGQSSPGLPVQRFSNQCVYPVGLDPVWSVSSNYLNFVDSLKMKISVIIAVFHMTLGILIKAGNSLYFKRKLDLIFEFVPQLIFMIALFGYMDFLIVYKWLKPWQPYSQNAPSIITTMINVPLRLGQTENCCGGQPLWGLPDQTSQNSIQLFLLVLAVICIPIMLIPKPIILIRRKKKVAVESDEVEELAEQKQILKQENHQNEKEELPSEIFVHQLIETIEFVLGSISNTASYLRLWALSLAHSQLSQVFFEKTVEGGIAQGFGGMPKMIFLFPVLAAMTFGVLLCMDSMQCFLHTLRLHWVQFQNKFYKGGGYPFITFNFKSKIAEQLSKS